jgi:putative transposase
VVVKLQEKFTISEGRACRVLDQPRASQRYEPQPRGDEGALVERMLELVRARPRFGYRRIMRLLQREGWRVSATRIYRLWRREGLKVPQKQRKRRRLGTSTKGCQHRRATGKDHVWAWDFVFDRTIAGSTLKWLSIVDEYTRECLALKVDRSIPSEDVTDTLAELFAMRSVPRHIRSDNGPEFIAQATQQWAKQLAIETLYVEPGNPLGERPRRELPQPAARRILSLGGVREPGRCQKADGGLVSRLQPSPAAQLTGVRDPGRVRDPLGCFRSGFGYASALTPAAQRHHPSTFITAGTGI